MAEKLDRSKMWVTWFKAWLDATYVPVNWILLIASVFSAIVFAAKDRYSWSFWASLILVLWSVYDIIKWRRRKKQRSVASNN